MIPTLDQTRVNIKISDALKSASAILHPKFKVLLNPNVVETKVKLTLHLQNGELKYLHDSDKQPAYVQGLNEMDNSEQLQETLKMALRTLKHRLDGRMGCGWHGAIILEVSITNGQASIVSEADGVHRLG